MSKKKEAALRAAIVQVGRLLYERGLIVAGEGNISVRLSSDRLLATASGGCKGMLSAEDLVIIDLEGNLRPADQARVSSEILLHLGIYQSRPDVQAVVHAHPPAGVACTLAGVPIDATALPEVYVLLGEIPTAPFAMFGTSELFDSVKPYIAGCNAVLLSHHGAVTMGDTLLQAFWRMEHVEHAAKMIIMAHQLGGPRPVGSEYLERLAAARPRYGGPVS